MRKQNWEISHRYNTMHDKWIVKERSDLANYYNPYLKLRYNVTSTSEATPLISESRLTDLEEIIIDGESISPLVGGYIFATTGEHEVWLKFTDEAINYNGSGSAYVSGFSATTPVTEIVEIPTDLLQLTSGVFNGCNTLVKANLKTPNGKLQVINNNSLSNSGLLEILIPNSVEIISAGAFLNCQLLENIIFSESLREIKGISFQNCVSLTEVVIPNSVTTIEAGAFWGSNNIEKFVFSSSMTTIEAGICGNNTNLKEVIIPEGIKTIKSSAFNGCTGLTELVVPNSVTTIEAGAFSGCSNIERLVLPSSMTAIEPNNWSGNANLKEVIIPEGIITINAGAFYRCIGLTELVIPNSVTTIEGNSFWECSGLTKITSLATTAPTINSGSFSNVAPNGTLYVPYGCTEAYAQWMSMEDGYLGAQGWTIQELPKE